MSFGALGALLRDDVGEVTSVGEIRKCGNLKSSHYPIFSLLGVGLVELAYLGWFTSWTRTKK
jgi:hypothetical protein